MDKASAYGATAQEIESSCWHFCGIFRIMQKSLLHYGRTVPKAVLPAGDEEFARRSAFKRAELARLGLDGSWKKTSICKAKQAVPL
eukprot:1477626-Amphidinium_carterae.1